MNHWFLERLQSYSDQIAISDLKGAYPYNELLKKVKQYQQFLEQSFKPGERIILESDYSIESIALFIAFSVSRLIVIPVISDKNNDLESKISASNANAVIHLKQSELSLTKVDADYKESDYFQKVINLNHSGLILFSSGTTGIPKAMLHDLTVLLDTYRLKRPKKLSIMIFLMFDHIGGINTLFNVLSMGAKAVIPENRNPETIARLIEQEQVNILPASPTFLNLLLLSDVINTYNLNSLRMITYGTEPMPESLLSRVKKKFPKARLLQTFGTSETGIAQVNSRSSSSLDIKIDDPNMEYKIVDGELWLKSKTRIIAYLNAPMESFTDEGWFKTGDMVEESDNGFIKLIGRKTDIINVGGEKVSPVEVESFIMSIEGVKDCLVYGERNSLTGQTVVANIVKQDDIDDKTIKNRIRKQCLKFLARYKVPTKITIKQSLSFSGRFKKDRGSSVLENKEITSK